MGMSEQDTREQLEADVASILRNAASHTSINTSIGDMLRYTVPGSGAAPWQTAEDACNALALIAERQIAELTAELYRERKSREHAYNKLNKMYAFDNKRVKRINELTAELETYRKYAEQGECVKPQSKENGDTREQLEADVHQYANPGDYENTLGSFWEKKIISFLDRQAAITRRETLLENPLHNNPYVGLVRGKQWERKQASDYYCGRCGWKVTDHDSYCPECGGAFHKASNKPNSQFDVLKTAETAENVTSKSEICNFDDTRKQLEADVRTFFSACDDGLCFCANGEEYFIELLDRQAAITEREVKLRELYKFEENHRANIDATEEVNRKLNERIAELTAERDELQAAIDAMENGQFYAMYKAKCEECEQLKKVVRTQAESFKKLECELAGKDG